MENSTELKWKEFDRRLSEIESRASKVRSGAFKPGDGLLPERHPNTRLAHAAGNPDDDMMFLKSELEQLAALKESALQANRSLEALLKEKESEITGMFMRNKQLEDENYSLRLRINRADFEAEGRRHHHRHHSSKHGENSLLAWLRTPVAVIGGK